MNWQRLVPTQESLLNNRWLKWLKPWLDHPRLWHWSRRGVALGVALGVFFGLLIPIGQIPASASLAIVLRANIPMAAASTFVSNPVTFAPIYFAAYQFGAWVTGEEINLITSTTQTNETSDDSSHLVDQIVQLGFPLMVGLSIFASFFGLLAYLLIDQVWRWRIRTKWKNRRK